MKNPKLFPILGMLTGVIMLIVGLVIQGMDCGDWVNPVTFGGDFYTESHYATARAACNIAEVGQMLRSGLTAILSCLGLTNICYFGCKLNSIPTQIGRLYDSANYVARTAISDESSKEEV